MIRLALLSLVLAAPALAQPADDPATWDQTAKGVRLLGGAGSFVRFDDNTSATLSPRVGLFVADGLALSADLQLAYTRTDGGSAGAITRTSLGVGPTVTYYLGRGTARPFVEGDLAVSYSQFSSDLTDALGVDAEGDVTVGAGLGAGLELPIARNVALRGEAFYRVVDLSGDNDVDYYGLSVGFATFLY